MNEIKNNIRELITPLFERGHLVQVFSNHHGEYWIAYINRTTGQIHLTGCDVNFKWAIINPDDKLMPWIMNEEEKTWLCSLVELAHKLKE